MDIDPKGRTPDENYKLITGLIVPRPIAWITSLNADETINLAPFSAFNLVTHKPPMLMVSIGTNEGKWKDTYHNILARREFVVNIASFDLVESVHASSAKLPYGDSETDRLRFEMAPSRAIATPRLAKVAAALECRLRDHISYEDADSTIFVANILNFYIRDGLLRDGKIDVMKLNPLARIGGPNYVSLGELQTLPNAEALIEKR